jgi:hypothetical protein
MSTIMELAETKRLLREAETGVRTWTARLGWLDAEIEAAGEVFAETATIMQKANGAVFDAMTAPGAIVDDQSMYVSGQTPAGDPGAPARVEAAKARYQQAVDDNIEANKAVGAWEAQRDEARRAVSHWQGVRQRASADAERLEAQRAVLLAV